MFLTVKRHLGTFFSFGAMQMAQIVLPLAVLPWLARILGPESFGLLMYMCLLPPLVALVMDWGLVAAAARTGALQREAGKSARQDLLENVLSAKLLLGLACLAACLAALPVAPHAGDHPIAWLLACGAGMARGASPAWFFQGAGAGMKKMAVFDVAGAALVLVLSFIFIRNAADWPLYLLFLGICKGGAYFWLTRDILKDWPARIRFSAGYITIWHTRTLFAGPLATTICNSGSQFIMGYWLSAIESGLLNACHKMFRAVAGIANPAIQTLYPECCRMAAQDRHAALKILTLSVIAILICMSLVSFMIFLAAPWLIEIALGRRYTDAVPLLRAMLCAVPLMACNQTITSQGLLPLGLERTQAHAMGAAASASIPLAILLASQYGLEGCAWLPFMLESLILPILCLGYWKHGRKQQK